jgi:ferredoxin
VTLEIRVDRALCRGAGECCRRAPHTFDLEADGKARVVDPEGDDEGVVAFAARCCPNFAISVTRDGEAIP